jgi:Exostosin family
MRGSRRLTALLRGRTKPRVPCVDTPLRVYTYELSAEYAPTGDPTLDLGELRDALALPSETFYAIRDFFSRCVSTKRPEEADYFFVPLNLILFQFRNEDPADVISELRYLGDEADHILVATGDFSNRSKRNHQGEAYLETYDWLDSFVLLALESTADLIPGRDIGVIPFNTLAERPVFNTNARPLLYSFLGELDHAFLPSDHVRSRLMHLDVSGDDALIGSALDDVTRRRLRARYPKAEDDYELISRNSVFTLAPAGYGRWTYRFFQAIQWGSIPVLLSDDYEKPFAESIPYDSFSLTVAEHDLDRLDTILRGFSAPEIERFQRNVAMHQSDFTQRSFFEYLTRRLEEMRG